jgi:phenylalanyl-tRNA synthetase alpha chain
MEELRKQFESKIKEVKTLADLETIRLDFFGKTGKVSALMLSIKDVPNDKKREFGLNANALKNELEKQLENKKTELETQELLNEMQNSKTFDATLPSKKRKGSLHPITIVTKELTDIFKSMGFVVEDGNEVETEYNNFEAVNVAKNHPARDMQDTFWLEDGRVLKTHTSAAQNRILKKYGKNVAAVFPGRCYRNEDVDATHEVAFFQLEGMVAGDDITIANLIYFMKTMLSQVFKKEINVRLRPGYFPFVEPGFELDIACPYCEQNEHTDCKVCKNSRWIELCPCGMIHPKVFKEAGLPETSKGFAFGLGLTRLAMMKYQIKDIRLLNSGNVNFLKQTGVK